MDAFKCGQYERAIEHNKDRADIAHERITEIEKRLTKMEIRLALIVAGASAIGSHINFEKLLGVVL